MRPLESSGPISEVGPPAHLVPANTTFLQDIPFFSLLDEEERTALAQRLDRIARPEGHVLFHVGDPGETLYVIIGGEVELFFKNDSGERVLVETARPGDFFGDLSLLDGGPRTTSAIVTKELSALVVDRGDLDEFLRLRPAAALDLLTATGRRLREASRRLRHSTSRNPNVATLDNRSITMRIVDGISSFSGSLPFLWMHLGVFLAWILLNVRPLVSCRLGGFDRFPFGLLTMAVSLEAILLSVLVLLSQNRQVARDRVRNDIEYEVNLKAELEVAHLHEVIDDLRAELLAKLEQLAGRQGR